MRRLSLRQDRAIGRHETHRPRLAIDIARIAHAGRFGIRPSILRALVGEGPRVRPIGLCALDHRTRLDLRRKARERYESSSYRCSSDDRVSGLVHDTSPCLPCFAPLRLRRRFSVGSRPLTRNIAEPLDSDIDPHHTFAALRKVLKLQEKRRKNREFC